MGWSKLLCRHIFKETKCEGIGEYSEYVNYSTNKYQRYAHHYKCLKCGKTKITASKTLII